MAAPAFTAARFFAGGKKGGGVLQIIFSGPRKVCIHDRGKVDSDRMLVLDQALEQAARPTQRRQWRIRQVAPGCYAGTLTDAAAPVSGSVEGNSLNLRFRLKGSLDIARVCSRLSHPAPPPPWDLHSALRARARGSHSRVYLILFALPLLGWLNALSLQRADRSGPG